MSETNQQYKNEEQDKWASSSPEEEADVKVYSEEMEEIVGRTPPWVLRSGVTVVAVFLLLSIIGSYFVKYPDVITLPLKIESSVPAVYITSNANSRIEKLLVKSEDLVKENQVLAILKSNVNYYEITDIVTKVDAIQSTTNFDSIITATSFVDKSGIGEFRSDYNALTAIINMYDSMFIKNYKTTGDDNKREVLRYRLNEQISRFIDLYHIWENKFIIKASADGNVVFNGNITKDAIIYPNMRIMTIVSGNATLIGKLYVPVDMINVHDNTKVLIKLASYPSQEYGVIKTYISRMAKFPFDSVYTAEIKLKRFVTTSNKKKIELKPGMNALAEIVTEEKRLISRLMHSELWR